MKKLLFIMIALVFITCNTKDKGESFTNLNLDGFEQETIDQGVEKYVRYDGNRIPLETGILENGEKNGVWIEHWPENGRIKTLTTYVNGKKNGIYLSFNNRGQIEKKSNFANDQLHGYSGEYKFGRTEMICKYKKGKLDGDYKEFFKSGQNAGNLEKLVQYKDGVQDGRLAYFNENGEVLMEYLYEKGEKVSGGIIKK